MDPVSTIASVITLIGATGGTIKVIHDTITSIKDAPKDIRRQCKRLECLCVTLNSIVRTCQHLPDECEVDVDLCGIEEFIDEARALEANLNARRARVAGKNIARFHESCKWLFSDRQLKRFFESLDQWDTILSQALQVVQIALSNRILTHTSSLISLSHVTLPTPAIAAQTSIIPQSNTPSQTTVSAHASPTSIHNTHISGRQLASLAKIAEPAGMITNYWYQMQFSGFDIGLHGGKVILKRWSRSGREGYTTLVNSEGQHVSLIVAVPCITARQLKVSVIGFKIPSYGFTLNFRWNLRHYRILPYDHSCFVAIERGDLGYLQQQLVSKELSLSDCATGGYSLLHFAVRYGRPAIVAMLINEGLEADVRNDCGQTPLHIAVQQGTNFECARLLLENGADAFQQDNEGRSALHYFYNDVVRQILLYYADGIDPWMQDRRGLTVLHWVSWSSRSSHRALVSFPHKSGEWSSYGVKDIHGRSMLHYAVKRGNADLIAFLLASPDAAAMSMPDLAGETLLHHATESGRPDTINVMLERSIDLDVTDSQGRTVLHHAAMRGNLVAAQRLIELGATHQLSYKDHSNQTPADLACQYASDAVQDYFETLGHSGIDAFATMYWSNQASARREVSMIQARM
ncbi:ankryin repeat S-palmitoyl transferase [Alternaria alternata]|nr:ankryin repeat S-palmitoyl transferase [Alternaria alternata]